jgi:hypothetical protein
MAEQEKIGKPWNDDELDAIVADYFSMLKAELSRQPSKYIGRVGRNGAAVDRWLQTKEKLPGVNFWGNRSLSLVERRCSLSSVAT